MKTQKVKRHNDALKVVRSIRRFGRWVHQSYTYWIGTVLLTLLVGYTLGTLINNYEVKFSVTRVPEYKEMELDIKDMDSPVPEAGNSAVPKSEPKTQGRGKITPRKGHQAADQISDLQIAKMIKAKSWDYSTAIRLAKSENYWNLTKSFDCTRTHTNKNGSVDYGLYQINSIHESRINKLGMTMEDMKDCQKNIDYAHDWLYTYQGWSPWVAWKNNSYLAHAIIEL